MDDDTLQAVYAGLAVYQALQREIDALEQTAHHAVKRTEAFQILQTITGIGKILGLTIMLKTGDIHRFAGPGNFAGAMFVATMDKVNVYAVFSRDSFGLLTEAG